MTLTIPIEDSSCEDLVEFLMKTPAKMTIKHSFSLRGVLNDITSYIDILKVSLTNKMSENTYSVIYSTTFGKYEKNLDNEPATSRNISNSKVESKPSPKLVQQGEKS